MSRYGAVNRRRRWRATCAPTVIPFRRGRGRGGARVAGMFGGGRDCTRISADDRYGTGVCVCDCAISVFSCACPYYLSDIISNIVGPPPTTSIIIIIIIII